jgi:hypothetical protein
MCQIGHALTGLVACIAQIHNEKNRTVDHEKQKDEDGELQRDDVTDAPEHLH